MAPRECYRPPWNINEVGELMKVKVDYQAAYKHMKRAAKRADNVTPINTARTSRRGD